MADWRSLEPDVNVTVFRDKIKGIDNLRRALRDFEILCVMRERTPLTDALIESLPNLLLIASTGAQNFSIDAIAAEKHRVAVTHTPALPHPTVELTFALMLELARRAGRESVEMKNGKTWQDHVGVDLFGKTLGVVGLGRLGAKVAAIAAAFGMKVIAWSPNLTSHRCAECGVGYVCRDELFRTADFISMHMQLSARTRHLVGDKELRAMRPGAFLINTSRAQLIDEAALVSVLTQ